MAAGGRVLMGGWVWIAAGSAALVGVVILAVLLLGRRRRRFSPPEIRWHALQKVGYQPREDSVWRRPKKGELAPRRWSMPIERTVVTHTELPNGGSRWTVSLHQYATLTLQIEERAGGGRAVTTHPFPSGISRLDERFVIASETPSSTAAVVHDPAVVASLLEVPFVSLSIHGDELRLDDPDGRGVAALLSGKRRPSPKEQAAAVEELHGRVLALVLVILRFFRDFDQRR
jgi:hypothetical protein